jgi:hypothetical protein
MHDDSALESPNRKTKMERSMTLTDSFRMAASVLQGTAISKKSLTLTIPSTSLGSQIYG